MSDDSRSAATDPSRTYILVSTDGHCGADLHDYRPYLSSAYHERFDAWVKDYRDPWADADPDFPVEMRLGTASFEAPLNWEGQRRLAQTEKEGVAAEVLFPNTAPPFYPSNAITAAGPRSAEEYELRWEGVKAHNRWLADFCAETPGRRAGIAQVFLTDVDAAIAEVEHAKNAGLKGVLLPGDHVLTLHNLYYPQYDRFWAACSDMQIPVHRHGIKTSESAEEAGKAAVWVGSIENSFFQLRAIAHLICAGVFERFPNLRFVLTEMASSSEVPNYLARLDRMFETATQGGFFASAIQNAHTVLSRRPSDYYRTNIHTANPLDMKNALDLDVPNLMWGTDLPHAEGCSPFTAEALRVTFASMAEEPVRKILGEEAIEVYGLDRAQLREVADRIGPQPGTVARTLDQQDWPNYPLDTRCMVFSAADTAAFASK